MSIKNNTTSLQNLLDAVNALPEAGGVELPSLTNEGSASDLLSGKQLINGDGNIVTGNIPTVTQATPSINVNSAGLITASTIQTTGYISAGTKSSTKQLTTQAAKTITPTKSSQTAVASGVYTTGAVTVAAIPSQYITTTDATASASEIMNGETAYVNGNKVTGTFSIDSELSTQDDLIAQIQAAVDSLPEAGGGEPTLQSKTVTPSTSSQTVTADSGYDGLNVVTVNPIPSTYVKPTSTKAAATYTPTTSNQTIPAGTYCSGVQTIEGDANLIPANIVSGKSIFGVVGSAEVGGDSGEGNAETATVTIIVDAPPMGTEKVYYESLNGISEITLMDYVFNPVSISCKVPSTLNVYMASLTVDSGNIERLYSSAYSSAFYITGNGTLHYIG